MQTPHLISRCPASFYPILLSPTHQEPWWPGSLLWSAGPSFRRSVTDRSPAALSNECRWPRRQSRQRHSYNVYNIAMSGYNDRSKVRFSRLQRSGGSASRQVSKGRAWWSGREWDCKTDTCGRERAAAQKYVGDFAVLRSAVIQGTYFLAKSAIFSTSRA